MAADTSNETPWRGQPIAVLASGGVDSCVLLGELAREAPRVVPLHVRFGLRWEETEQAWLERFLAALSFRSIEPMQTFEMPLANVYGEHWSLAGDVPDERSSDEAVYLPGRNLLLLAQTALWCQLHGIGWLALGPLAANPFPDGTEAFFDNYQAVFNQAVEGDLRIVCPYRGLHKTEVLRRGREMPLEYTFSCIRPVRQSGPTEARQQTGQSGDGDRPGIHCGRCNKCAERRRAFAEAGIEDTTAYENPGPRKEMYVSRDP